ncbi:MAG TPA: DUF6491 family protein [Rhizomicrobium sp.]
MKKHSLFLIAAGFAVLAAGPALAQSSCLRVGEIDNFKTPNDKTVVITDNFHQKFRVNLMGTCPLLTFKQGLAIKSFGGSQLSCVSGGDSIITHNMGMGAQRCAIRSVEPYTMDMQKADDAAAAAGHGSSQ